MTTLFSLSQQLGQQLLRSHQVLTSAESCTGGGVAFAITDIPGSSAWFDRAFVTYSNQAKQEMIGVQSETLAKFGAVSEPVVQEMVQGALAHSRATMGVAISGIAGPDGGSEEKPVGTVCFAWADTQGWQKIETRHFTGDRAQVRQQAMIHALQTIADYLPALS
ncbi:MULTISPECIES: nicotinamide-nucleotide amidase [Vibrio]|uniref:nicotinamide-nucleotide amidase n=1 Tax=Vibrio TaxID=662 RepID=UPI000C164ACF|nr:MULTISPECIES: nicotinamide-nucleotide amidase [Vibrio]NAW69535.1 nicotinamide-nucleotide amidase [Vibrio sp. V28_P6S34P95]NAX05354.1 nicotinamide-nucleotide amidase [Vibrio sp. V30_P3S12P165]NAX33842.1 nicotinamide-nucleotide amidase [Vibrio sp. V29_P1S30P107]NAX37045.1 nicotinamide-nucleotide amidase [Vibrio sp. V27_P1S3P104]NAX39754.1 nicotinamide-nucleotide amidase [Vibrio sp. V26_P1S5P106]